MAPNPLPHEWWHRCARISPGTSKVPGLPFEPGVRLGGHGVRPSATNLTPFPHQEPGPSGASPSSPIHQPMFVSAALPPATGLPSPCKEPTAFAYPQSPASCPHSSCDRGQGGLELGGPGRDPQGAATRAGRGPRSRCSSASIPSTSFQRDSRTECRQ